MELIRIGEKSVKATLTREDMRQYALLPSEGDPSCFSVTRRNLRELLERIRKEIGADFSGERAVVRFFRSEDSGCELYITASGEELSLSSAEAIAATPESASREKRCSVFLMPDTETLLSACRAYLPAALPEDSAYMAENGQLFLLVQGTDEVFLSVLSEFGERQSFSAAAELVLEHGAPLCPKNAVFKLAELINGDQKPLHTPFRSEYSN